MAYYRTLKNGERKLIYTKADRAKQEERANLHRNYPPAKIVSVYVPNIWHNKDWDRAAIEYFWKFHNYNVESMQASLKKEQDLLNKRRAVTFVNLQRDRGKITSAQAWPAPGQPKQQVKIAGQVFEVEASPGYIAHDRVITDSVAHRVRNMQNAIRAFS
jgi:hypothetical protein